MINSEGETRGENNLPQNNNDDFLNERIVVHTMHKGANKNLIVRSEPRNTGLIIIISGIFLLIVIGGLSYYLVVKKNIFSTNSGNNIIIKEEKPLVEEPKKPIAEPVVATTTQATATVETIITSTSTVTDLASSSEILPATSTASSSVVAEDQKPVVKDAIVSGQTVVKEAIDTDADGLGDLEEEVFGTDKNLIDTDGDKYSDFQEVDSLHNPSGRGMIASNTAITEYVNSTYKYSLLYPLAWLINNYDNDDSVMFKIDGLQFVQIMAQQNTKNQTLEEWYKGQFSVDLIDDAQRIPKSGWNVIKSKDGLNWFLMKDGSTDIFIISYNIGINNVFNYKTIFQMMINSFDIK